MFLENIAEMIGMSFAYIFNAKIAYYQTKYNRTPLVTPKAWRVGTFLVTVFDKAFLK